MGKELSSYEDEGIFVNNLAQQRVNDYDFDEENDQEKYRCGPSILKV